MYSHGYPLRHDDPFSPPPPPSPPQESRALAIDSGGYFPGPGYNAVAYNPADDQHSGPLPYGNVQPSSASTASSLLSPYSYSDKSPSQPLLPSLSYGGSERNEEYDHAKGADLVLRVILPGLTAPLILGLTLGLAAYLYNTEGRVPSAAFAAWCLRNQQTVTFALTLLSGFLSVAVTWSFGRGVAYLLAKRIVRRAYLIKDLQGWIDVAGTRPVFSSYRMLVLAGVAMVAVQLLTPGFSTLITPSFLTFEVSASGARELDFSSDAFATLWQNASLIDNCDQWPTARGVMMPGCPWANAFPAMLQAGRSAAESRLLGLTAFSRVGMLNILGSPAGVFPFTSVAPVAPLSTTSRNPGNSIDLSHQLTPQTLSRVVSRQEAVPYNLTQNLQGVSASIACRWTMADEPSPIQTTSSESSLTSASIVSATASCNSMFSYTEDIQATKIIAAVCEGTSPGVWNLYIRNFGFYEDGDTSRKAAGTSRNNLTCTVEPFLTASQVLYASTTNTTNVDIKLRDANESTDSLDVWTKRYDPPSVSTALRGYLDHLVQHLPLAINIIAQSNGHNLVQEGIIGIITAFNNQSNQDFSTIWPDYLRGMIELDASYLRHYWEYHLLNDATSWSTDVDGFRTVTSKLTYGVFAWRAKWSTLLYLLPVTLLCLVTIMIYVRAFLTPSQLPAFDPTSVSSLMVATARGDLREVRSSKRGVTEDRVILESRLRFTRNTKEPGGPWGLMLQPKYSR